MSKVGAFRIVVLGLLLLGGTLTVAPTASAHDPDCLTSAHVGTVRAHVMCDPHKKDESDCTASVKVMFIHQRLFCE